MAAVHRTILLVDVAHFNDIRRTNVNQAAVRASLYDLLETAWVRAGIRWPDCDVEDRGDGLLMLAPPEIPKAMFVEALPGALVECLDGYNGLVDAEEQIRLRMALHAGEITYDAHGVVGRSINLTFRLLDSAVLRRALARASGPLAIITSPWFYDEVVWHSRTVETYTKCHVISKDVDTPAWLCLPGSDAPPAGEAATALPTQLPIPRQLPATSQHFVGRNAELEILDDLLLEVDENTTPTIAVIDGTAGVGKTALALHWAHLVRDEFPDGQLHVNLRGFDATEPVPADWVLHGFLQALGLNPESIPTSTDAKAALYRSMLAGRRMLIVLDNARSSDHIRPLLPGAHTCMVLVTSRRNLYSLAAREGVCRLPLRSFSQPTAEAMLARRIGDERVLTEPGALVRLAELCARLPLALSIVAARIAGQPTRPLQGLVRELYDERGRLDSLDLGEPDLSVRVAFSWSYAELSPDAQRLFRLFGIHPGPDIDSNAMAGHVPNAHAAINELVSAHLVEEHTFGRFRCHSLLHTYSAELSEDPAQAAEKSTTQRMILDHYLSQAEQADRAIQKTTSLSGSPRITTYADGIDWFVSECAVLLELVRFAGDTGFTEHAWRLAAACNTFLRRSGRWLERVSMHRQALVAARRADDRLGQAVALGQLGPAVSRLGEHAEALEYLREAVKITDELGDERTAVAVHLACARVFDADGRHGEALEHARLAWALVRAGDDDLNKAHALTATGRQLIALGRARDAKTTCLLALNHYSAAGHPEGEADVLVELGSIEHRIGTPEVAISYYQRSLDIDRTLGDRYWEAHVLEQLGRVYRDIDDDAAAAHHWRAALAILQDLQHPDADRLRSQVAELTATEP